MGKNTQSEDSLSPQGGSDFGLRKGRPSNRSPLIISARPTSDSNQTFTLFLLFLGDDVLVSARWRFRPKKPIRLQHHGETPPIPYRFTEKERRAALSRQCSRGQFPRSLLRETPEPGQRFRKTATLVTEGLIWSTPFLVEERAGSLSV